MLPSLFIKGSVQSLGENSRSSGRTLVIGMRILSLLSSLVRTFRRKKTSKLKLDEAGFQDRMQTHAQSFRTTGSFYLYYKPRKSVTVL